MNNTNQDQLKLIAECGARNQEERKFIDDFLKD